MGDVGGGYCLVGTGFQFGMMKHFWRWMGGWAYNEVDVLNATEMHLKMVQLYILCYVYFTTIKTC